MSARVLLIDNYDSFTFNLAQQFMELGAQVWVHRNDRLSTSAARALAPTHLCISPGPGAPESAGVSVPMIRAFAGQLPILGVCLGLQALVVACGGQVVRALRPMHGKTSLVEHDDGTIVHGLPQPFAAGRYHSLIARRPLPDGLEVMACTAEQEIMGVRHTQLAVAGVQFHPESILTPHGPRLLENFLQLRGGYWSASAAAGPVRQRD
jgi:anthranilate synthase/aminodeoxychorismate synthase-like glutamine amidotransferase